MFEWDRRTQIVILVLLAAILFGAGVKYAGRNQMAENGIAIVESGNNNEDPESNEKVYVHITGAVEKPGLYCFTHGTRLNDAVSSAKPLPEADLEKLNLASIIKDEERIVVPERDLFHIKGDVEQEGGISPGTSPGGVSKININTATAKELETLPGIGPAYADRIINYRETNGIFSSVEKLQEISGIGPKTYDKLKDLVAVN